MKVGRRGRLRDHHRGGGCEEGAKEEKLHGQGGVKPIEERQDTCEPSARRQEKLAQSNEATSIDQTRGTRLKQQSKEAQKCPVRVQLTESTQ